MSDHERRRQADVLMPSSILEKGVPIPKPQFRHRWADMEVTDSLFFPQAKVTTVKSMALRAAKRLGFKFTLSKTPGGVRVWRIK